MENKTKPLKRHEALVTFSREHHHCLLLSWKIRKGLSSEVSLEIIKEYADWFYENYLNPLFKDEEKYIFPILGEEHKQIKKVLSEHRRLKRLFSDKDDIEKALHNIEEELDRNIRFKERELFQLIQEAATEEQLENIKNTRKEILFVEHPENLFWED